MLPLSCIPPIKLSGRPANWLARAKEVLVNTEYSMYGRTVLPFTRWDEELNRCHRLPDFQPFEHFVSGRYIGEIVRRVAMEGIETADMFGGQVPSGWDTGYGVETKTLGFIERRVIQDEQ
jgi:hexokinase